MEMICNSLFFNITQNISIVLCDRYKFAVTAQ